MENGEAGRATSCSFVSEGARRSICPSWLSWVCLEDRLAPMRSLLGRLPRLPDLQI